MKKLFCPRQKSLWLPDEDLNPDKQSQSLSCCRYTIGQYLTCFTIIVSRPDFVKGILKKS